MIYSGPVYAGMQVEGNRVRVKFDHLGGGLESRSFAWLNLEEGGHQVARSIPGAVAGFTIASEDGKFVPAEAKIDGQTVIVWSDQVPKPTAVRYAWADDWFCALRNKAGLPAAPFRTDAPR